MKKIKYLVLHCTATPEGREVTADEIKRWHTDSPPAGRGWKQVGYSKLVHLDGTVSNMVSFNDDDFVDAWEITNGVAGINSISRHFVYAGGLNAKNRKTKDTRTAEQLATLESLVLREIEKHPNILVAGHNQFAAKDCPSFDVPTWLRSICVDEKNIYTK